MLSERLHTLTVNASHDSRQGVTGVGIVIQERQGAGRRGPIVAQLSESRRGAPPSAAEAFAILRAFDTATGLPALTATAEAQALAGALLKAAAMPAKAAMDAAHVAIATAHGMNFLLTWNCAHIANAVMRESIEEVCRRHGFKPPVICTPEELILQEDT